MIDGFLHALALIGAAELDPTPAATWLRVVVGLVGLALLGWGAAMRAHGVRLAIAQAGLLVAVAVVHATEDPHLYEPSAFAGACLLGAAVALWIQRLVSFRLGLGIAGLVAGGVAGATLRDTFGLVDAPWPVPGVAIVGAVAIPWVFETFPRVCSAALGAAGLAWAVGFVHSLPLLLGAWLLGTLVQLFTGPQTVDLGGPSFDPDPAESGRAA